MGSVLTEAGQPSSTSGSNEARGNRFTCKEEPIENQRPLKVRVIGAGLSGVYLGIRIPQRLRNIDLKIYEKNDGLGGTWWENRYPGCACDIPAHSYQFTFEPNKNWSGFYAPSKEIREYIAAVAEKYGANRFIQLQHKVKGCAWDDTKKQWHIIVTRLDTGETFEEDVDVLVSARGNLNEPKWPAIPGFETFQGEKMHSAAWKEDYDFTNKRIAVIGGGSSSIQIVPELRKVPGAKLSVFVRNKTWITNRFGDYIMDQIGWDKKEIAISKERQEEWEKDDAAYLRFRKTLDDDSNSVHFSTQRGSAMQADFVDVFSRATATTLTAQRHRPDLLAHFSPDFGVGCRRITPGPGYLEALCEDNVELVTAEIQSVNEKGLVVVMVAPPCHPHDEKEKEKEKENDNEADTGRQRQRQIDVDVLVCATGFHTSAVPPFPVTGQHGHTLADKFRPFPQTYLSVAVDGFPNYFMMLGPNSGIGAGSLNPILEAEGDYIVKCIRKLQKEDYVTMAPLRARVEDFGDYVGAYFPRTVYMDDCKSWYKTSCRRRRRRRRDGGGGNSGSGGGRGGEEGGEEKEVEEEEVEEEEEEEEGRGDRISALWPGCLAHLLETLRAPRWEDFAYEARATNRLGWLGNGFSVCLTGGGDSSFYLNPDCVEVPPVARPEEDARYQKRPFSH